MRRLEFRSRPSDFAVSSPVSMMFRDLSCVVKYTMQTTSAMRGNSTLAHVAAPNEPRIQNVMDCICSASAKTVMMRLENAPNRQLMIVPDSTSLTVVVRPPAEDSARTAIADANEPMNAKIASAALSETAGIMVIAPNPMAKVAPNDAPEDIPRMYGSASGFWTVACMTTPARARAPPTIAAITMRGALILHTML